MVGSMTESYNHPTISSHHYKPKFESFMKSTRMMMVEVAIVEVTPTTATTVVIVSKMFKTSNLFGQRSREKIDPMRLPITW